MKRRKPFEKKTNKNIFYYYINRLFKFNTYKQNLKTENPNSPIGINIYSTEGTVKDFVNKQQRIHWIMKYLILVPGMKILNGILGKHLTTKISSHQTVENNLKVENKHLINLRIFDKIFNSTVKEWHDMFLCKAVGSGCKSNSDLGNSYLKNRSVKLLISFKNFMTTFITNDTAYLTFFDMLSLNFSKSMIDYHKGDVNHLFYNSVNINDIRYFILKGMMPQPNIDLVSKLCNGNLYVEKVEESETEFIYHLSNGQAVYTGILIKKPEGSVLQPPLSPVLNPNHLKEHETKLKQALTPNTVKKKKKKFKKKTRKVKK